MNHYRCQKWPLIGLNKSFSILYSSNKCENLGLVSRIILNISPQSYGDPNRYGENIIFWRTHESKVKPEDNWSCKRSPDILA